MQQDTTYHPRICSKAVRDYLYKHDREVKEVKKKISQYNDLFSPYDGQPTNISPSEHARLRKLTFLNGIPEHSSENLNRSQKSDPIIETVYEHQSSFEKGKWDLSSVADSINTTEKDKSAIRVTDTDCFVASVPVKLTEVCTAVVARHGLLLQLEGRRAYRQLLNLEKQHGAEHLTIQQKANLDVLSKNISLSDVTPHCASFSCTSDSIPFIIKPDKSESHEFWWIYPTTYNGLKDLVTIIRMGGIDGLVSKAGKTIGIDDPIIYTLCFGASANKLDWPELHSDSRLPNEHKNIKDDRPRVTQAIVPLQLHDFTPPELLVQSCSDPAKLYQIRMKLQQAIIFDQYLLHQTCHCEGFWSGVRLCLYVAIGPRDRNEILKHKPFKQNLIDHMAYVFPAKQEEDTAGNTDSEKKNNQRKMTTDDGWLLWTKRWSNDYTKMLLSIPKPMRLLPSERNVKHADPNY